MPMVAEPYGAAPATTPGLSSLTLRRLTLRNFKGIREFVMDADDAGVSVYGDNATGKTTLFDAFVWLLFDKDSQNRKDFEVKTLDKDGQAAHGLEHEVEGVFSWNGKEITLRKVYSEKWTKQRGSAEKVFTGHTTDYFVDGVPVAKGEYEKRIALIVDEKVFRLLSDPSYFNEQLHWQDRRKLLLEICGDISDKDVIASDSGLSALLDILGQRSLDDHRKVIAAQRTKINKDIEQIPVRISEVQRGLPDVEGLDASGIAGDLSALKADRKAKMEELTRAEQGGGVAEKQSRLSEVRSKILDLEVSFRRKAEDALGEKRGALQDAKLAAQAAEREAARLDGEALRHAEEVNRLTGRLEELREQWHQVSSEEFAYAEADVCPTCGQDLPEQMVAEAREKALSAFNLFKSERLERINADGKSAKALRDQAQTENKRCSSEAETHRKRAEAFAKRVAALQAELDKMLSRRSEVATTPEYTKLTAERDALAQAIERLQDGSKADLDGLRAEIAALDEAVGALERSSAQMTQREAGEKRIAELQAEENKLAVEYERLEKELYLTEEFIRAKVRLLEDRINSRFRYARFKLFDVQVNGGLTECCETLHKGVPYGTNLNRGARINIGLDIINTLTEHYAFAAPIWIDNAEAVTRLIPVDTQVIRLVVCAPDKTWKPGENLRVVRASDPTPTVLDEALEVLRTAKEVR